MYYQLSCRHYSPPRYHPAYLGRFNSRGPPWQGCWCHGLQHRIFSAAISTWLHQWRLFVVGAKYSGFLAMAGSVSSADSLDMEEVELIDSVFGMDSVEVKLVSKWSVDKGIHCKRIGFEKLIRSCRTRLCLLRNSANGLLEFGKPSFLDWPDKILDSLRANEFSRSKATGHLKRRNVFMNISLAPGYIISHHRSMGSSQSQACAQRPPTITNPMPLSCLCAPWPNLIVFHCNLLQ